MNNTVTWLCRISFANLILFEYLDNNVESLEKLKVSDISNNYAWEIQIWLYINSET